MCITNTQDKYNMRTKHQLMLTAFKHIRITHRSISSAVLIQNKNGLS